MSDLRDFTDRSVAWDALARKNVEVTNLKAEIASLKAQLDGNRVAFNLKCAQLDKAEAQLDSARKALERVSEQLLSSQMDEDQRDHADWQGGYDAMVISARAAKAELTDD